MLQSALADDFGERKWKEAEKFLYLLKRARILPCKTAGLRDAVQRVCIRSRMASLGGTIACHCNVSSLRQRCRMDKPLINTLGDSS